MAGRARRKRRSRRRPELSQHFIKRTSTARRLVALAELGSADFVVEAGPGDGALTAPLIDSAGHVIAVETDRTLYARLKIRFADAQNLTLRLGDFLKHRLPSGDYTFFANIPYARTADIVKKLTLGPAPPTRAFIIMETVAATRFLGQPFGPESMLSLMIKYRFDVSVAAWLAPPDFSPPSVNSVMLKLVRKETASPVNGSHAQATFDRFAKTVFNSPDRNIRATLRRLFPKLQARSLVDELGLPAHLPPSAISFEHWRTLFELSRWNSMEL